MYIFYIFSGYVLIDPVNNILTPQKVFVCISLLNMLRVPLVLFPITFKESITMLVSLRRITDFLNADELETSTTQHGELKCRKKCNLVGQCTAVCLKG